MDYELEPRSIAARTLAASEWIGCRVRHGPT